MEQEPGVFRELVLGIRNVLSERLVSPLMPAFTISWLVVNYRLVLIIFCDQPPLVKLSIIDTTLYPAWQDMLSRGLLIPLAAALAYIFIYPYPAKWVYRHALIRQRELREARQQAENARVLTVEESQRLRTYYYDRERALQKQVQERQEEIEQLRAKIAELEKVTSSSQIPTQQTPESIQASPLPTLSETHVKALGALSFAEQKGIDYTGEEDLKKILETDATEVKIILEELQRAGLLTKSLAPYGASPGPHYGLTHEGRKALKEFLNQRQTNKESERRMTPPNSPDIGKSTAQFVAGMQNIERAIIAELRRGNIQITADSFMWNRGKELIPPPEAITLEIKFQGKSANGILSREQVEDSHERIDRADVVAMVNAIVKSLSN